MLKQWGNVEKISVYLITKKSVKFFKRKFFELDEVILKNFERLFSNFVFTHR